MYLLHKVDKYYGIKQIVHLEIGKISIISGDIMSFKEICIKSKTCRLMKSVKNPKYGSTTILTDSCWEYVSLFLKRQSIRGASDALFYWNQAHSFYCASKELPDDARPLTSYYCILNISKALLRYKGVDEEKLKNHGISSVRDGSQKTIIKDSLTAVKGAGVLPELARYYGVILAAKQYSIADLLYNIPCVHRAYCVTFSKPEIFIPVVDPRFVKKEKSTEAYIEFYVNGRCANKKALQHLSPKFEHDIGVNDQYVIRMKERFKWDIHKSIVERKKLLNRYHEKTRKYLYYINGKEKLWYIKKDVSGNNDLSMAPSTVLIFAVFHWISELVRYNPKLFNKYMKSRENWLFHEFIYNSLDQLVDEIGCEITGEDIMCTGCRS